MSPLLFVAGPFCASCQVPVEAYTVEFPKNPLNTAITITGHCHGKSEVVVMSAEQVLRRYDVVLFQRKQGFDTTNLANTRVIYGR